MEEKDLKQIRDIFREEFAQGFGQIWEHNISPALDEINDRIDKLEREIAALSSKVTNYLELSDKRYLELKRKNLVLAKWIKVLADKTGVKLDLKELEDS